MVADPRPVSRGINVTTGDIVWEAGVPDDSGADDFTSQQTTRLNATYVPKGVDGQTKPRAMRLERANNRLGEYRVSNNPPAISATNSPSISNAVNYTLTTDGVTVAPTARVNAWGGVTYTNNGQNLSGFVGAVGANMHVEFVTDSVKFVVEGTTGNAAMQILCNGEVIWDGSNAPTGGSWWQFNWNTSRQLRRYVFRGIGVAIRTIRVSAADSLYAPQDALGPKIGWMGDSYSQRGTQHAVETFPHAVASLLGWRRVCIDAQGGSGYAQDNGGAVDTFLERVPAMIAQDPDVYVFAGGHNKAAGEDLAVSVPAVLNLVRASKPTHPIIVFGPFSQSTTYQTTNATDWTKMQAAAAAAGALFVDTRDWITGTGYSGAATNDGNADALITTDGVHFSTYGTEYVAMRAADAIAALI